MLDPAHIYIKGIKLYMLLDQSLCVDDYIIWPRFL
jgi:hypothetical protein